MDNRLDELNAEVIGSKPSMKQWRELMSYARDNNIRCLHCGNPRTVIKQHLYRMDLRDGDVVVLHGAMSMSSYIAMRQALRNLEEYAVDVTLLNLPVRHTIERLGEDDMLDHGWVRA